MEICGRTYIRLLTALLLLLAIFISQVSAQDDPPAADRKKQEMVRQSSDTLMLFYLLRGPDIQGNLDYALMSAASEGSISKISWLIKNGADVNTSTYEGITPLILSAAANKIAAARLLLENNADPNVVSQYSETPLLIAVKNDNMEMAELLIRDSADINFTDRYGATPLHYASAFGYFYIADLLIYYNAAVFKKDDDGTTPLMAAIWAGHPEIADLLMQNGADPSERDNDGFTPFLLAAQNGDTVIMSLLRKRMVNIYELNKYGYDALDLAVKGNHLAAVNYLLRAGDKWNDQNDNSVNPNSVALIYKRKEIAEALNMGGIEKEKRPGADQLSVTASFRSCWYDFQLGISATVTEPVLNLGFQAGLDFKPFYTRVLVKEDENSYYQYRDKSYVIYAGLIKQVPLTDNLLRGNWSFIGAFSVAYGFGNRLRGTGIAPGNEIKINPAAGFRWIQGSFGIYLGLEYLDTDYWKVGPVWLRVGLSKTIYFNNIRAPGKTIRWY